MSTRNDRFNASMRSLDELTASFEDPSKAEVFSDRGLGVERMLDEIDNPGGTGILPVRDVGKTSGTGILPVRDAEGKLLDANGRDARSTEAKLHRAEMRLYRAGVGYLVKVLRLIVKNGTNRKESIWELARR